MADMIFRRPVLHWVITLIVGILLGVIMVGRLSAAPEQRPLEVAEQNLDASGNIKVHEQGTADVNVTNESLDVAVDFPEIQDVKVTSLPIEGTRVRGDLEEFILGNDTVSTEVPIGTVLTDVVVSTERFLGPDYCFFRIDETDTDDPATLFEERLVNDQVLQLHFETGLDGPLEISIEAEEVTCEIFVVWSGFELVLEPIPLP